MQERDRQILRAESRGGAMKTALDRRRENVFAKAMHQSEDDQNNARETEKYRKNCRKNVLLRKNQAHAVDKLGKRDPGDLIFLRNMKKVLDFFNSAIYYYDEKQLKRFRKQAIHSLRKRTQQDSTETTAYKREPGAPVPRQLVLLQPAAQVQEGKDPLSAFHHLK